ncbi:ROK family transcriptional regulator [Georgenia yuyongxinii]|uniref:ROK family transcriptional regulator n=1 Tax=Georgenia yuyongxinii TaxID=2589797 RepID=UPI001E48F6C8|nr:ROK family transcriptional regulator [Georgenia yuyongxinii]
MILTSTSAGGRGDDGPAPTPSLRQASLRELNLAVVCAALFRAEAPLSRAELAARTGMTRATASRLVDDLLAAGILEELEATGGRRGRPAVPLRAAAGTFVGLGLEVNVDYLAGQVVDLRGRTLAERVVPRDVSGADPASVLADVARLGTDLVAAVDGTRLVGTVLAVPGLVDRRSGQLLLAPNLQWRDVDLVAALGGATVEAFGGTVTVANEAKLAALAMATAAPGRLGALRTFLYVSAQVGVGAAAVVDGEVMTGPHGWAGEIGHISVEPDGPPCRCGARGCLEQYAGKAAVLERAGLPLSASPEELLGRAAHRGPAGDRAARALDRAGWALGVVLSGAVNLLDIDQIVLGGELAPLTARLRPRLEAELHTRVLASAWASMSVTSAPAGPAPAARGAALRAVSAVLREPARWVPERGAQTRQHPVR